MKYLLPKSSVLLLIAFSLEAHATTWALNYSGEWNDDSRNTELGLLYSSVYNFRPDPSDEKLEIRATTHDHGNPVSE
jgi:hypothetical protein